MSTRSESLAPVTVSGGSSKMLQLLRKRLRQLLRVTLVLASCGAMAAGIFAIWWLTSLNGLPDIGEPFDVAEFRAFSIPDEHNAFTYLRRAQEKCVPFNEWGQGAEPSDTKFSWSIAIPKLREWAGLNQEALELFQEAAEQPDAANPAGEPIADLEGGLLFWLAVLDASRRQESGDTAGAWDRYRAVLGMITHFRRRGSSRQRGRARAESRTLQRRLVDWAADPRTTIAQLHTALDEVLKNEPIAEWSLFAIKSEYLEILRAMERPIEPDRQQEIEGEWTFRLGDMALSPGIVAQLESTRRFLLREPERSRRVLRLLCANYLAHAMRGSPSPKPAVWVMFSYANVGMPIYAAGPEEAAGARALPPQELARWLVATLDARLRMVRGHLEWQSPDRVIDAKTVADRKAHRELVVMLAKEIYRREHGALPSSDEALVGPYLKSLPADGSLELVDEVTPIVE
jgi:hypothetical protein